MQEAITSVRTCPDCGGSGVGNYCANCGEEMEPYLPKVREFFHELLSEFVALDSKIVRTIPGLFRPGFLTKEYFAGRRKKYLLPSRVYVLLAVTGFFILGNTFERMRDASDNQSVITVTHRSPQPAQHLVSRNVPSAATVRNGHILFKYFLDVAPYLILIGSTPLFALILKLLYRKKKVLYVQHLIFSFHVFAFGLILLLVPAGFDSGDLLAIACVALLVYLYFALRNVYSDRGSGLVLRFVFSSLSYIFVAIAGIVVSVLVAYLVAILLGEIPKGADAYF